MLIRPKLSLLALPALLALGAGAAQAATPGTTPTLAWRGDLATSRALMQDLGKAWTRQSKVPIHLQPFSTISGIDAVAAGRVDFGGSARPAFVHRQRETGLDFVPVAWDAVVLITHHGNPVKHVSLRQLNDIYYGRIINWKALGGPNRPIHLYAVAGPLDGIEYSLRQYLFGRGNQPVAAPRLYINTRQLEAAVAIDPLALGASTLSSVAGNRKLDMLAVEHVQPSRAHLGDGSYPLSIPLYLVVAAGSPRHAEVEQFIDFLHGRKAAHIMRANHLLPYRADGALALGHHEHLLAVQEQAHHPMNGPVAAPGATYAAAAAVAPTSQRTVVARRRLQQAQRRRAPGKLQPAPATSAVAPAPAGTSPAQPAH
ncbi:MAG TPA: substrate-binding domain-containing protein [Rhodanobacteraceae bacterium]|nr:substrate-binding domain-containing protein [Rhodanobacteraceae bacterium]